MPSLSKKLPTASDPNMTENGVFANKKIMTPLKDYNFLYLSSIVADKLEYSNLHQL